MNIIRKIKLNKLGCYKFKNYENELVEFIVNNLLELKIVKLKESPNYVNYMNNDNKKIFQHNIKSNELWSSYTLVWSVIKKIEYNDNEIKYLLKSIFEHSYKLKNVLPYTKDPYAKEPF